MAKPVSNCDMRIGLIGLRESGKSHLVAVLPKVYYGDNQDTTITPSNAATIDLYKNTNRRLFVEGKLLPPSPLATCNLYSLSYKRSGRKLMGGFEHDLQILDFSGERFIQEPAIFSEWLAKCNALVFLIGGNALYRNLNNKGRDDPGYRLTVVLFEEIRNQLILTLRRLYAGKKIYVSACLTQTDLFESQQPYKSESLVEKGMPEIHEIVQTIATAETSWCTVDWHGISSLGYVWDPAGKTYMVHDKKLASKPGNRVSQYARDNATEEEKLRDPVKVRPEGLQDLLEDIHNHIQRHTYPLSPVIESEIVAALNNLKPPNSSSPNSPNQQAIQDWKIDELLRRKQDGNGD